jgi:hypothetical protein
VSTILDALRKLQRDRERTDRTKDLRESVAEDLYLPPPRRTSFTWLAVLGVIFVSAAGVGALVFLHGDWRALVERAWPASVSPAPSDPQPKAQVRRSESPPTQRVAQTRARPRTASRPGARAAPQASRPSEEGTSAIAQPSSEPADAARSPEPARTQRSPSSARAETRAALASTAQAKTPALEAPPAAPESAAATPETALKSPPKPSQRKTARGEEPPKEATAASRRVVASAEEPKQPESRRPESNPFLEPFEPVTRVQTVAPRSGERPEAGDEPLVITPDFPDLVLESVRWHPDPSRRRATMVVDQARNLAVREGDIVQGALIQRIDPGTVELRVGMARKRLQLEP